MIFLLKIFLFFPLFFGLNSNQDSSKRDSINLSFSSDKKIIVGEDLTYVVKYSIMNLGEVRLKVRHVKEVNGKNIYDCIAYIDSYEGIPFVNLHQIYETKMNDNFFSEFFRGIVTGEEYTTFTEYFFNYDENNVRVKKGRFNPYKLWNDSSGTVDKQFQDGLSIFYYARVNTGIRKTLNIPCFVKEEKVNTKINFYNNPIPVSIDAVDYDINCVRIDGVADFVSVFGLTGYFEGWFTNDEAAIPIVAKMKVVIGNITLELKNWKRDGWKPPEYIN